MTPQNPAIPRKARRIAGKESRLSQETAWLRSCRFLFYPFLPGTKPALPQGTRNDAHREVRRESPPPPPRPQSGPD